MNAVPTYPASETCIYQIVLSEPHAIPKENYLKSRFSLNIMNLKPTQTRTTKTKRTSEIIRSSGIVRSATADGVAIAAPVREIADASCTASRLRDRHMVPGSYGLLGVAQPGIELITMARMLRPHLRSRLSSACEER